jgi:uncharacterized protein
MPDLPLVIPLFPLGNVVLFPHVPVPLHIFEPRYRKMVADALGGPRVIGMILLRPGWEKDYDGRPPVFEAGCAGLIDRWEELPDGRYNILLRGLVRFRVREEHDRDIYRMASVDALPDQAGPEATVSLIRERVVGLVSRASGLPVEAIGRPDLSDEVFVNALCQSLELDPLEKQALLDSDGVLARYERLAALLEFRAVEQAFGKRPSH